MEMSNYSRVYRGIGLYISNVWRDVSFMSIGLGIAGKHECCYR